MGDLAPRGRGQCLQTRQVVMTGRCARRGPLRAKARPGQRHQAAGLGRGKGCGQRGGWVRAEPLMMGGHPAPHPLTQPRLPAPCIGRWVTGGTCVVTVPALRRTRGVGAAGPGVSPGRPVWPRDSCVLLAEGPRGGARGAAWGAVARQGAAGQPGPRTCVRGSGAAGTAGARESLAPHAVAGTCPPRASPPLAGFLQGGAAETRVPECPPAAAPKGALLPLLSCRGALRVCIPVFWGDPV